MRILYWCGLFWPRIGGAEVLAMHYVDALSALGHEVLIVTDRNPASTPEEGLYGRVPIVRLPFVEVAASRDLPGVKRLSERVARIKSDFQPDIVHLNSTGLDSLFHALTLGATSAPSVLTVHGLAMDYETSKGTLLERAITSSNWVIGVSAAMLKIVTDLAPGIRGRSSVILNALNEPGFDETKDDQADADSRFGLTVLCAGRLVPEKGVDLAIEACRQLLDEGVEARLVIAGEGPESARLKALAGPLVESGKCVFHGWVAPADVYEMIRAASVVVVPSRWEEPFGLTALQAGQCGRPVVAARSGGLMEVVEDGVSGILFEKNDHRDLARTLKRLAMNKALRKSMGSAGYRRATELFSMNRFVKQHVELYKQLMVD